MSAMVAYPNGAGITSSANTASMYDTSSTSGCQSSQSGGDDVVERSRSSSPISLGAFSNYIPKNGGQLIRNRIFVCGFGNNTAEDELRAFFEQYGNVKDVKVIADKTGSSKGYGFVTFESEEEAKRIIKDEQNNNKLNFKDRTLNIGPAVKREVARNNAQLANHLNHVLGGAAVPAELTTGHALFYQSPAALAQVLLPASTCNYPSALSSLGLDANASLQYAAYANQNPFQYAVLGNHYLNYQNQMYQAPAIGANAPQYIDQKYVQSAINGTLNTAECFNNNSQHSVNQQQQQYQQQQQQYQQQQQQYQQAYPQASLSQLYAASGSIPPTSELMYYGRSALGYQQLSQANSLSSLSSSVDSAFPTLPSNNGEYACPQQQAEALQNHLANSYAAAAAKLGGGDDADLAQSLSSMAIGQQQQDAQHVPTETDMSAMYQQAYAPQMYNSMELVQAAAAAAAWTYQQNLQSYAKSIANSSATSNFTNNKTAQQQQSGNNNHHYHHANNNYNQNNSNTGKSHHHANSSMNAPPTRQPANYK